jgi:hypothetical protein
MKILKGKVLQYKSLRFTFSEGVEWSRVNSKQAMRSILNAVKVEDENYRCLFIRMISMRQGQAKSMSQVWASWFPEPREGDIVVCLYHDAALEDKG